jgi:O-antigen/teichoic acid export membrane protein
MHIYNKYLAHPNGRMMAIAAGAACLTGALVSAEVVLTALRKNKTMLALSITLVIPLCLLKLAVIKYYGTVFVKYFVDCIEIAIIAVAAWLVCKSSYKEGTYTGALKAKFKTIIKDSYPLWLNGIILVAYSRYDQLFVGIVGSLGETADYAIATQLNSLALIIPTSIALVIFPKMVELRNSNTISYEGLIIKIYRIMMLYAGAWMIMVFIFGEFAIKLLYGESYLNAAIYLRIVSIGTIFTVIGQVSGQLTVIEGKYWMSIKRSLVGIAFMIIANYTISSANNIKIVAYVTVVNLFIVNILMYIVLNDAKSISKLFFKAIGLRQVRY